MTVAGAASPCNALPRARAVRRSRAPPRAGASRPHCARARQRLISRCHDATGPRDRRRGALPAGRPSPHDGPRPGDGRQLRPGSPSTAWGEQTPGSHGVQRPLAPAVRHRPRRARRWARSPGSPRSAPRGRGARSPASTARARRNLPPRGGRDRPRPLRPPLGLRELPERLLHHPGRHAPLPDRPADPGRPSGAADPAGRHRARGPARGARPYPTPAPWRSSPSSGAASS